MGDGCMMEGISHEVASLAGHLRLDNLIAIYDANNISLDGPLAECCSEDTKMRFTAYGWEVFEVDGNDLEAIAALFSQIKHNQQKPRLIIAHTIIGKGSPHKAGSSKAHGAPLGIEEVKLTKEALGIPQEPFYIPQSVSDFFRKKLSQDISSEEEWNLLFDSWSKDNPQKAKEFEAMLNKKLPLDIEEKLHALSIKAPIAGRKASQEVVNSLAENLPWLIGGSADLSCSDLTTLNHFPVITPGNYGGRNIKFGVREFGMAAMATGISQTQMLTPFIGTFLTFSDYMRNAIRLAALMRAHVIYQFTHDSIFLGEDGPTHQPIEHLAALRAIPYLQVIRPADDNEVKMAWLAALRYEGPTALILSRQSLPQLEATKVNFNDGLGRGAYIVKKEMGRPDFTLVATGSELSLALDVAAALEKIGKNVRVISMPCWELFEKQTAEYRHALFGGMLGKRVSIEAGVEQGWHKYIGCDGTAICIEGFGASAPYRELLKEYGFTVESILERIL